MKLVLEEFDPAPYLESKEQPVFIRNMTAKEAFIVGGSVNDPNCPLFTTTTGEFIRIPVWAYSVPASSPTVAMPAAAELGIKAMNQMRIHRPHDAKPFDRLVIVTGYPVAQGDQMIVFFGFCFERE